MIVANPSTPAQMFHLLRRQVKQSFRKPLIVFTPKSLLRHPSCVSSIDALCSGSFSEVISETTDPDTVRRVMICSGKIYYDLKDERDRLGRTDTALVRVEQLYPFRDDLLIEVLSHFSGEVRYLWVQEEPENMGAWQHLRQRLVEVCGSIRFVGRPADSCPAVGSHHLHQQQQAEIVTRAFEG
jgi:2-oxoglutarate dehydrogenase E1 component